MAVYGYTKNYKLVKPEYDSDTWHDYEYDNLDMIDSILSAIYQSGQFRGFWANNTSYKVKDVVIDKATDTMYTVITDHTTPSDVTFEAYREANPSYYRLWNANELAKDWAIKTDGKIVDYDVEDYSAKAYAIGGTGLEQANAKYYAEQAGASEDVATEKANAASVSAAQALVSETNAKTSEVNAKESETNAKTSEIVAKAAQDDPNVVAIGTDLRDADSVIKAVNDNKDDISSVAHIKDQVVTVSSAMSEVVTVAGIEQEVTTVAGVSTQVKDVGDNIQTVLKAPENEANSRTWAEGTDEEVSPLGGTHSSKGWAMLARDIVKIDDASETNKGIVRLATEQEAETGANDTTAMTPLKTKYVADDYTGKGLQLGFNGTLESGVLTFNPDESSYVLKQGYDYEIDLLFPAVGVLPDDTQIVIKNGSDTIQVVNVRHADASTPITYGDMKQICRYDTNIGWRWVFNARYAVTDTGVKVFVMPSYAFQDDRYVTTDTAQNINAGKNFINNTSSTNIDTHTNMSICLKNEQAELGADTTNADGTVNFKYQGIRTVDKNNEEVSYLYSAPDGVGGSFTRLGASTKVDGEYADAFIDIEVDANGKGHLYIPDVDTDSTVSGNQAATKEYVDANDASLTESTLQKKDSRSYVSKFPVNYSMTLSVAAYDQYKPNLYDNNEAIYPMGKNSTLVIGSTFTYGENIGTIKDITTDSNGLSFAKITWSTNNYYGETVTETSKFVLLKDGGQLVSLAFGSIGVLVYAANTPSKSTLYGDLIYWYDATNNLMKKSADKGATWTDCYASFPLASFGTSKDSNGNINVTECHFCYSVSFMGRVLICLPFGEITGVFGVNSFNREVKKIPTLFKTTASFEYTVTDDRSYFGVRLSRRGSVSSRVYEMTKLERIFGFTNYGFSANAQIFNLQTNTLVQNGKAGSSPLGFCPLGVVYATPVGNSAFITGFDCFYPTLNAPMHPIVQETYRSGTSWYRIWSDGWIEQGGILTSNSSLVTYNFVYPFADTNYLISQTQNSGNLGTQSNGSVISRVSNTQFNMLFSVQSTGLVYSWYACGY